MKKLKLIFWIIGILLIIGSGSYFFGFGGTRFTEKLWAVGTEEDYLVFPENRENILIELFMGLRRLEKPVWMLQYNGEAHNIRARKNRKDITIRLQQFFDHYLKGEPMPEWMKNGIPMTRKGQEMGTGYAE